MTDKYEELREALEKATPGDWTWDQIGTYSAPGCAVLWPDYSKSGVRYRRLDYQGGFTKHDANFITNAKRIVPALLSSHDAQAAKIAQDKVTIGRHESTIQELMTILSLAIEFDGEDEEGEPAIWLDKARAAFGEKPCS